MKRIRWIFAFIPAVVGAGLALYFFLYFDLRNDHIVYLRADLGTLSLILGLLLSGIAAVILALLDWSERYRQKVREESTEERRRFLRRLDHELKNPLTAIRAGLVNLSESPSDQAASGRSAQRGSPGPAPEPFVRRFTKVG